MLMNYKVFLNANNDFVDNCLMNFLKILFLNISFIIVYKVKFPNDKKCILYVYFYCLF